MKIPITFWFILILPFQSCFNDAIAIVKPPNVLLILTDDQGWGDLSIHGNLDIQTPNIDQIAIDGASFHHFYVQPVCSPTRAEILTGRYHVRSGVRSTSAGGERIDLDEQLISEVFKNSGYRTACFGKWHSGGQHPYHPNNRGFDEYYGFTSGHWGHYFDAPIDHNGILTKSSGYLPNDLTDRAIEYMGVDGDPFFIFLAYNTPHSPMQVPDEWWQRHQDRLIEASPRDSSSQAHSRAALAMVENLDDNIGRIQNHLVALGLSENTILLFMSDNGPNGIRWNGGMKGRKGSTDEGGVRSPLFIRWPLKIKAGIKINEVSAAIDLAPTLIDLCHLDTLEKVAYDGISLAPLLLETGEINSRNIVQHWRGRTSIRNQNFRLDYENNLYDIQHDPGQSTIVNKIFPAQLESLVNYKSMWREEVLNELTASEDRPFPVGYSNIVDYLPARDGVPSGQIKRSNRYPNDSYFYNLINTNDSITWNVDIMEDGVYEFSVFYTCPDDKVGSTMKLEINGSSLYFKITQGHDPELMGMKEDRVRRIESYVKDFRPLNIGQLELKKGKGLLVLKAVEILGDSAMEINRISVRRMKL